MGRITVTKNNSKELDLEGLSDQILKDDPKKLDSLKDEIYRTGQYEKDFVFNPITEASNNISRANEFLYNSEVKDLDVSINIALNLVSFSIALLIAFITIPQLGANWIVVLLPLLLSTSILIKLLLYRRKQSLKLSLKYLEGILSDIGSLSARAERHLTYVEEQNKSNKNNLLEIHKNLIKSKNLLLKGIKNNKESNT